MEANIIHGQITANNNKTPFKIKRIDIEKKISSD
jgi:hypothetical protein